MIAAAEGGLVNMTPNYAVLDLPNIVGGHTVFGGDGFPLATIVAYRNYLSLIQRGTPMGLATLPFPQARPVSHVHLASAPAQVVRSVVTLVTVRMKNLLALLTRPVKRDRHQAVNATAFLPAVFRESKHAIAHRANPRLSDPPANKFLAVFSIADGAVEGAKSPQIADFVKPFETDNGKPFFHRFDLAQKPLPFKGFHP